MSEIVLHHYEGSMFSEKIRLLLGHKRLSWRSVIISPIMPRPALMPLTGGYRRTPVMQIGADVYCDTRIIAERIEALAPEPAVFPTARRFDVTTLAEWADTALFQLAVAICFQPRALIATMSRLSQTEVQAFAADRAELGRSSRGLAGFAPADAEAQLLHHLANLESQLAKAGPFLGGAAPLICDFSVYHCLWLVAGNAVVRGLLEPHPALRRFMQSMEAIGHGRRSELDAEQALEIALAATPECDGDASALPDGPSLGDNVTVTPLDYGRIPVSGRLACASANEYALRRTHERTGELVVHFPRAGFALAAA